MKFIGKMKEEIKYNTITSLIYIHLGDTYKRTI